MGENTILSSNTPNPSENRNMYSSMYSQKGLLKETNSSDFQIMQIIPPFTKSTISNTKSLNNAYLHCTKSILNELRQEARNQITISGSFPFVPPSLVGAYYLQPPDARAIFLHNDLLCNDTCSVTGGA